MDAYQPPQPAIEFRVEEILARMTREEKVGQMLQLNGGEDFVPLIRDLQVGSLLHINGDRLNQAIELAAQTRLGIPLLFADDAIHGHSFWPGATIFPTQLALAMSWNPSLLERVARVTAVEMTATGPRWTFSPVLCLTRDLRWGRVGETFGEDPFLIGELAAAMIQGYQTDDWTRPDSLLATAKHYAGYSETQGGRDATEADLSPRKLRSYFLPPFEKAVDSGCQAFMTGYQSMEGVPSTANRWLLTEVLKEEWGFQGLLVTDWDNVGALVKSQRICADYTAAAVLAVRSGNDLMMATPRFYEGCLDALARGLLQETEIDAIVRRILALKFRLGLFENPGRSDPHRQQQVIGCPAHQAVNLEAARQCVTLLHNNGLLPWPPTPARSIAVIGPNADDDLSQLGDWSLGSGQMGPYRKGHPRECTVTILDGIRELAPPGWTVGYAKGCDILSQDLSGLPAARALAEQSDVIVAVVGDTIELIGEGKSTATLELQGGQIPLLEQLAATGKPMVVVLLSSKPLVLPPSATAADALFCLFNPGMQGGRALAEALWGQLNPSGKLTVSFPRHAGQQPVFYSQVRGQHGHRYADLTQEPQFAFGQGLGYSSFVYRDLQVLTPELSGDGHLSVEITVANTGSRDGVEIAQLYIEDVVTSATWVNQSLKAWQRVALPAGQEERLRFQVPARACWLINAQGRKVVEPGQFIVRIGSSSRYADLLEGQFRILE